MKKLLKKLNKDKVAKEEFCMHFNILLDNLMGVDYYKELGINVKKSNKKESEESNG